MTGVIEDGKDVCLAKRWPYLSIYAQSWQKQCAGAEGGGQESCGLNKRKNSSQDVRALRHRPPIGDTEHRIARIATQGQALHDSQTLLAILLALLDRTLRSLRFLA